MNHTPSPAQRIGIFDSGVGGLSVLRALHQMAPAHPMAYVADSGHAPYGDRDPAFVVERSLKIADHLVDQGAAMLIVACNTATAWAIEALRARHPGLPLVGVEPGVKPAAALSRSGRIAVMATTATLASPRFATLVERHAPHCEVIRVPCPGLAAAIEQGEAGQPEVERLLDLHLPPVAHSGADVVVLGCTHYPFVAGRIAARLPAGVRLLDTADAVARQALRLLGEAPRAEGAAPWSELSLLSTGDPAVLERLAHSGLGLALQAQRLAL